LNIIEYLFCKILFGKVLLIEKSVVEKVRQKNAAGKLWQKTLRQESVKEKVQQVKCGRKTAAEKV
jgi:hypothetical protein